MHFHFFPTLHLNITNIPLHAGTRGGFRGSCREKREGWGPTACQHTPLLVTQKTGGAGLGNHDIGKFCSEQSRHLCAHSHHPSRKKVSMKLQLWKLTQTALNFNSQPSQAQSPLITTRPMNVRCLEWKQRVKIPVWIFSWKSVIENHLSVRQN